MICGLKHTKKFSLFFRKGWIFSCVKIPWHCASVQPGWNARNRVGKKRQLAFKINLSGISNRATWALVLFSSSFLLISSLFVWFFCRYPTAPTYPFKGGLDLGNRDPCQCGISGACLPSGGSGEWKQVALKWVVEEGGSYAGCRLLHFTPACDYFPH